MVTDTWMTNLRGDAVCEATVTENHCSVCGRSLGMHAHFGRTHTEGGLCLACLTALEEMLRTRVRGSA